MARMLAATMSPGYPCIRADRGCRCWVRRGFRTRGDLARARKIARGREKRAWEREAMKEGAA